MILMSVYFPILPMGTLFIEEFKEHTSGGTGGDNGTVKAGLGDNVDLNGRVTARVVHGTGVNLGNRHFERYSDLGKMKSVRLQKKKENQKDIGGL